MGLRIWSALLSAISSTAMVTPSFGQVVITFQQFPVGTVITDQLTDAVFSSPPGSEISVTSFQSDNFILSTDGIADITIDFTRPVNNIKLDAVGADLQSVQVATFRVTTEDAVVTDVPFIHTSSLIYVPVDLTEFTDVVKLEIIETIDDPGNENGIGWDNIRFTLARFPGESCDDPIVIDSGRFFSGTFDNADIDQNGPAGSCNDPASTSMNRSQWFEFVPEYSGFLRVRVSPNDSFNPIVVLSRGSCSDPVELACAEGFDPIELGYDVAAGDTVYIQVGQWGIVPDGGEYSLDLRLFCQADTNRNGFLEPTDFSAWVNAFNNNLPECDQNGDGACTPTDFTAWINNYNAGC